MRLVPCCPLSSPSLCFLFSTGIMSLDVSGALTFGEDNSTAFRYQVRVWENALSIWIEDRGSKAQWQTANLKRRDFLTDGNTIPRTSLVGYAQRFVNCMNAKQGAEYTRSISTARKDGSMDLSLFLSFQCGGFQMRLEYTFTLLPIALERQDLLASQVRDHGDDLRAIQTRTESLEAMVEQQAAKLAKLEEDRHTLAYAHFEVADPMRKHLDTLVWSKPKTPSPFQLSGDGKSIRFPTAGVFMITANLRHNSASKGTHYEFCVNNQPAQVLSGHHVNGFQTLSFTTVMAFSDGDALSVDYCGGNYSYGGALTIVELRRN